MLYNYKFIVICMTKIARSLPNLFLIFFRIAPLNTLKETVLNVPIYQS